MYYHYKSPVGLILLILIFLFSLSILPGEGQAGEEVLLIDSSRTRYNLSSYLEILEDEAGRRSIEEVSSPGMSGLFEANGQVTPSYSYTDSAYWLRFQVEDHSRDKNWLLEVSYPILDRVDLYLPDGSGGYTLKETGDMLPFNSRELNHRHFVFSLPLSPQEAETFYLRVETDSAMIIPLTLWEEESFLAKTQQEYLILGLYFGIIAIMALYNFFLFLYVRSLNYLYYATYIVSIAFFHLTMNGLSFQYLWPDFPWWGSNAINFFMFLACFCAVVFVRNMLPLEKFNPRLDKMLHYLMVYSAVMVPLVLLVDFTLAMILGIATVLVAAVLLISSVFISWKNDYPPALYLLLGWGFLFAGALFVIGRSLGFLPDTFITLYGIQVGSTFEVILLSMGLAEHVNILNREKEKAQVQARDFQLEKQKRLLAETLNDMIRSTDLSQGVKSISETMLEFIKKLVPYHRACVFLKEKEGFRWVLASGEGVIPAGEGISPQSGEDPSPLTREDLFIKVLDSRKPLIIPPEEIEFSFYQYELLPGARALMVIPIVSRNSQLGIVVLEHKKEGIYRDLEGTLALNLAGQAGLILENAQLFEEVKTLAATDDLTGLYNRRSFYEMGEREIIRAKRYYHHLSLLMLDIDNFKRINDTYGHGAGDEILQELAKRLREAVRATDIVSRYGGEEFCILLTETGIEEAKKVAEDLRRKIGEEPINCQEHRSFNITASFGVTSLKNDTPGFNELVEEGDVAMYEAKGRGRNRVVAYSPGMKSLGDATIQENQRKTGG